MVALSKVSSRSLYEGLQELISISKLFSTNIVLESLNIEQL